MKRPDMPARDSRDPGAPAVGEAASLRAMADAAADSIFIKDRERRYTFVNRAMCGLFGCTPDALLGRTPEEVFDPASATTVRAVDDRTFSGEVVEATRDLEVGGVRHTFQTTQVPMRDADRRVVAICGFVRDVTPLRRAETDLRMARSFAENLIDLVPALILVLDAQGNVVRYNRYVEELTGTPLDRARGRNWFATFLPAGERDRVLDFYRREAVAHDTAGSVNGVRCRDGGFRQVEWHSRPVDTDETAGPAVLAVGLDITDRLAAEGERQRLETAMLRAQKLESLGVLAGGIAHDFNNILVAVMGNASLAARHAPPGSETAVALARIEQGAVRASELCSQLLAYAGRGSVTRACFDLNRLVGQTIDLLRVSVREPDPPAWRPWPEPLPVEGDATRIRQVVMNLVTNAQEAVGPRGGRVSVRMLAGAADPGGDAADFVDGPPGPGPFCAFEVADDGHGMDADTLARIFDPFFSTKFAGRGLGLSAVLGIVREHGGALSVRSAPGRGTTFRVLLPRAAGPLPPEPDDDAPRPSRTVAGGLVLVVDDEPANREVVRSMLERAGYRVRLAADGDAGLATFREDPDAFRLALLDLTMPGKGGDETFRLIRRVRADLPVVVMSGYGPQEAMQRFSEAPGIAFLSKPFSLADLLASVDAVLAPSADAPSEGAGAAGDLGSSL